MRRGLLLLFLILVMAVSSQAGLYAQIRIIPRNSIDSLSQARKVSSIDALCFDALSLDYGVVSESGPKVEKTFKFTNVSSSPVVISGVSSSCSCVVTRLERKTVLPAQTCSIDAVYNQKGHPGNHDRYIYLYVSDNGHSTLAATLSLTGIVVGKDVNLEDFPVENGLFRMTESEIHFNVGEKNSRRISIMNVSCEPHRISIVESSLPEGIQVSIDNSTVPSGGICTAEFLYDGSKTINNSPLSITMVVDGDTMNRFSNNIILFLRDFQ